MDWPLCQIGKPHLLGVTTFPAVMFLGPGRLILIDSKISLPLVWEAVNQALRHYVFRKQQ